MSESDQDQGKQPSMPSRQEETGDDTSRGSVDHDETLTGAPMGIGSDSPNDEADPALPPELGRYRIVSKLGVGGFGAVYLGVDEELDRRVAIKIPRRGVSKRVAEEFLQEARRLAKLRHPGIITVYDVSHNDDTCFIVTEFVEGRSMRDVVREGRMPWDKAVALISHVADALAHAHANGMIHRDIKPGNIILRDDGTPVVLDFGLALTDAESSAADGVAKGTPAYMAPEQALGQANRVDGRTDVFSLAVVLYEAITGRRPFRSNNVHEVLRRVVEEVPQPLRQLVPAVPMSVAEACERAMEKRMDDRFTTAGDFAIALRGGGAAVAAEGSATLDATTATLPAADDTSTVVRERRRGAERRHVTIAIFNFEAMSSEGSIDAEDQHELSRAFQVLVDECVDEFGGTIIRTAGQEVMACFGYPIAFEYAAQRAVRAALLFAKSVEEGWKASQQQAFHCELSTWGVIHSGDVVIEDAGGEGISLTGNARNVIVGLEAVAETEAISVSGATERLVQGFFALEELAAQRLRGMPKPISLYRLVGETRSGSRVDVVDAEHLAHLVGRDTELSILKDRWEQALEGLGQVVLLIGEAGLGKSRLIREIREHVSAEVEDPVAIVEMRCSPHYKATSFFPIVQFLRKFIGLDDVESSQQLESVVKHLRSLKLDQPEHVVAFAALLNIPLDERYDDLTLSPQRVKELTDELLLAWLLAFSRNRPVLFVVEDLHWVDPSTLDMLQQHVERNETDQVLTLLTFRPEFETPWRSFAHQTQIALSRLTRRQVTRMLEERLGEKDIPSLIVTQVIDRTEGVPLFIEEYAKLIKEADLLNNTVDATESLVLRVIPDTLQDLLVARLDRMNSDPHVVQFAATIGREFSQAMIAAVVGLEEASLNAELAKLMDAEIIFRKGASYIFKHALIQDAAYNSLLRSKRQSNHRMIATVLEQEFPEHAEREPELVAHHLTEAGENSRCIVYWLLAGQRAQIRSANQEAISHLSRGLEVLGSLEESPERDEMELHLQGTLGPVLMAARGWSAPEVGTAIERAQELCAKIGSLKDQFFVLWGLWGWRVIRADLDICSDLSAEILQLVNESPEGEELQSEVYWIPGCTTYYQGRFSEALEHLQKGLSLAVDESREREHALRTGQYCSVMYRNHSALALWELGYPDRAVQEADTMLEHARKINHPFSLAMALHFRRRLLQCCGLEDAVRSSVEEEYELCHEQGFIFFEVHAIFARGEFLAEAGDIQAAKALFTQGWEMLQKTGGKLSMDHPFGRIAECYRLAGETNDAKIWLDRGMELVEVHHYRTMESEFLRIRGELARAEGDDAAAEQAFEEAIAVAERQASRARQLRATLAWARLKQTQGQMAEGRQRLSEVYTLFEEGFQTADLVEARQFLEDERN